ncbi:MAG: HEAT repeat domain-containing protein [Nannocystaceae bacterium]|nr:HEAT repeat domain-containing protein [bacterium]
MQAPELTLAAAIRDANAKRTEARHKAIRSMAPAFLVEIDKPGPRWKATAGHEDADAIISALFGALAQHEDIPLAALAAIGLGMLGEPDVLDAIEPWVELEGSEDEQSFRRECAVITTGYVGVAAKDGQDAHARACHRRVIERLTTWFDSAFPDVRFQVALALVDVDGSPSEPALAKALRTEDHPEVREALVDALSRLDTIGEGSIKALRDVLDDEEEGPDSLGFEAAMVLAGAHEPCAAPRLLDALGVRHQRDRALEALAVLGPSAGESASARVTALARGLLTRGVTRVRAAYALARILGDEDNEGHALLRTLRWHPSAAVREAVADAQTNLAALG